MKLEAIWSKKNNSKYTGSALKSDMSEIFVLPEKKSLTRYTDEFTNWNISSLNFTMSQSLKRDVLGNGTEGERTLWAKETF